MVRKYVKLLGVVVILLQIIFVGTLLASVYTVSSSLMSSLTPFEGAQGPFRVEETAELSGGMVITFTLSGRNTGILDVEVRVRIKLLSQQRDLIAEGADAKSIPAGSMDQLTVRLTVPAEVVQTYSLQTARPKVSMSFECRTLLGLVGMGITAQVD